jgi:hypothetical protein
MRRTFDFPRHIDERSAKRLQKAYDKYVLLYKANAKAKERADKAMIRKLMPVIREMNKVSPKHLYFDLSKKGIERFKSEWWHQLLDMYDSKDQAEDVFSDDRNMWECMIDDAFEDLVDSETDDEDSGESWTDMAERDDSILSAKPSPKKRKKPVKRAPFKRSKAYG